LKLAISNIAWEPAEDEAIAALMRQHGFSGVEIAPTKIWPKPLESTRAERQDYRQRWIDRGLPICAMQSLLFGHPECQLFQTIAAREAMASYLKGMIDLAADVGAEVLVFGSPGNRKRDVTPIEAALDKAIPFFRDVGAHAASAGVSFCIEPNPPAYACDFITTSTEGRSLVDAVNQPGFGLHLDGAGMTLAGENAAESAARQAGHFRHFHLSAPQLAPVNAAVPIQYDDVARVLRRSRYERWVSIEMRSSGKAEGNLSAVGTALEFARTTFAATDAA